VQPWLQGSAARNCREAFLSLMAPLPFLNQSYVAAAAGKLFRASQRKRLPYARN
jgi:hypothetical protein